MKTLETSVKELLASFDEMSHLLKDDLKTLNQFDLTPQSEAYLLFCIEKGPVTAMEIAREFCVSKSAVSQAVARLEKERFIEREQNPDNKRETIIYLGPKGRMFARRIKDFHEKMVNDYYIHISQQEIEQMVRSLKKLNGIIREKKNPSRQAIPVQPSKDSLQ
ncbi:MarR family winged helix-turn-helix transcriptional regulator [Jeotgalibacillus sp. R-1-5s-1]|uniref:MarR family winged helix-turn-helix transcriptional regulator n=1 Tax=Jeotgalibacillus sp. R-1-5s-1 TaxID=2555897 RepID=UPI00106B66F9|nr:MarR family winged helix-turn-helix transcriptional regulator [Jeotgalibacillus sp. R-1-5s-1]TFE03382.1 MarR family transcriptional regulator [Jeotgalibacillus sp. R-1-5s-1]